MKFFKELGIGYKNYWIGTNFLFEHKLLMYFIFPLVLFIGVYVLGNYFQGLEMEINDELRIQSDNIDTINSLIWVSLKMFFFDALYIIFTQFTLYIVVVLLSPILAILSQKIESILTGNKYPFNFKNLVNDIKRGAIIAFRNLIWYYIFVGIFLGIVSFFDLSAKSFIIFAVPFIVGFYYYGFSFLDYINERRRLNIQQSVYFVSQHKGLAISIGSVYSTLFLLYFYITNNRTTLISEYGYEGLWEIGSWGLLTFAALSPILAITAATLSMNDVVKFKKTEIE
ncbi:MAG: EI24 domain-containing protein [Crocinitomicaceae bacterium]